MKLTEELRQRHAAIMRLEGKALDKALQNLGAWTFDNVFEIADALNAYRPEPKQEG